MNKEILLVAETVSNEKGVPQAIIFEAIELALAQATKRYYEEDIDVRVTIDPKTGAYETARVWTVVDDEDENFEGPLRQVLYSAAIAKDENLTVGDLISEPLPSIEFGRIAAQTAKQVIVQKVREAERAKVVEEYQAKVGTLLTAAVKKVTRDAIILDLGGFTEALLPRSEMLPREALRIGDRVKTYLKEVRHEPRGPQLFVSRTCPEMLMALFRLEVPEVSEDLIELKSAARDPGMRAKIAVKTNDGRIDPVGACVGMRGTRVQAISGELGGERIDIVLWDDNPAQLIINAMAPADIASIVMDEDTRTMQLAVEPDQLSQAIGRAGQNVRLASELTGWTLNVVSTEEAEEQSGAELETLRAQFTDRLGVDEDLAQVLAEEGFSSIEDVAYVALEDMLAIDGFDEELADDLKSRANDVLLAEALTGDLTETADTPAELSDLEGMSDAILDALTAKEVATLEDLAELAVDDLEDIEGLDAETAGAWIMTARAPWFADDADDSESASDAAPESTGDEE